MAREGAGGSTTFSSGRTGIPCGGVAIIASSLDPAGMNIRARIGPLLSSADPPIPVRLELVEGDLIRAEMCPDAMEPRPDLAIFISRHKSGSGLPCLTVHFPGNFAGALHGGLPGRVSMAAPKEMKRSFRHLWHHGSGGEYQVTVEATHHGPLTNVPCFFAEIGSTSERWVDAVAGDAVSRAVVESLFDADSCQQVAVGFGGPHYSDRFARLLLETDHAVSHIVPKHHISSLSGEMIETLFSRSRPPADIAILDWKGIRGSERRELIEHLREQGRDYLKLSECLQRDATGDP